MDHKLLIPYIKYTGSIPKYEPKDIRSISADDLTNTNYYLGLTQKRGMTVMDNMMRTTPMLFKDDELWLVLNVTMYGHFKGFDKAHAIIRIDDAIYYIHPYLITEMYAINIFNRKEFIADYYRHFKIFFEERIKSIDIASDKKILHNWQFISGNFKYPLSDFNITSDLISINKEQILPPAIRHTHEIYVKYRRNIVAEDMELLLATLDWHLSLLKIHLKKYEPFDKLPTSYVCERYFIKPIYKEEQNLVITANNLVQFNDILLSRLNNSESYNVYHNGMILKLRMGDTYWTVKTTVKEMLEICNNMK